MNILTLTHISILANMDSENVIRLNMLHWN